MTLLKTILKRLLQVMLLLFLVFASLWGLSRLLYPTEAQRQAVAELERWPDYAGENAFALLWTLDRDVPDDQLERVMAEDVRLAAEKLAAEPEGLRDFVLTPSDISSAASRYSDLTPSDQDRELFCRSREHDCLERVRLDPERYAALVMRHQRLLDRIEGLSQYGSVRSEFPTDAWLPSPPLSLAYLTQTRNAVRFEQGRTQEALAGVCRDVLTWRRLGARSDSLVTRMVGIAYSGRGGGRLLASMIAEIPLDEPLPGTCEAALAPPTGVELSMCNAMRGEFAINTQLTLDNHSAYEQSVLDRLAAGLFIDHEASFGMKAEDHLALCVMVESDEEFNERLDTLRREHDNVWRLECVGNLMTCVLDVLAIPAYGDYMQRVIDDGARFRLLGTLAWMRSQAGQGFAPAELLEARLAELNVPADAMGFGPDGKTLQVRLRWTGRGETWSIPVPPALYAEP